MKKMLPRKKVGGFGRNKINGIQYGYELGDSKMKLSTSNLKSIILSAVALLIFLFSFPAYAADVAICGGSKGYSYMAFRNLMDEENMGWSEDTNLHGQIVLKKNQDGELDIMFGDATTSIYSTLAEGGTLLPASISEEAVTVVVIYPNMLSETYIFQKLKNGDYQVMWTQAKSETPIPKVAAWVAECSYLDIGILTDK